MKTIHHPFPIDDLASPRGEGGITHVLIVEDDEMVRDVLRTILTERGFEVTVAPNAAAAGISAQIHPPDLLVADVSLPDKSGIELSQEIWEAYPHCQVILIVGSPVDRSRRIFDE